MKRLMITMMVLIGAKAFAQPSDDTTRVNFGGVEFIIIDHDTMTVEDYEDFDGEDDYSEAEDELTYWSGFHVGINMLMNENMQNSFTEKHLQIDPAKSWSYSFNLMEYRVRLVKDYVGIVTGIGFTNSRFGFEDDHLRLRSTSDSTYGFVDTTLVNGFSRNQLRVNYFNVPVLFQFNTSKNSNKNFHFSFGAIGGVRIGSKMKYTYDVFGGENDDKVKGRFNLNAFNVQGTVRLGYRDFGLFANYDVLPLFDKGKSTQAFPLTFGASFHF